MQWIKQGLIFDKCHAQVPIVDTNHDGFWRIYFSKRINRGNSQPNFIDVESGNPQNILRESPKPILELGARGSFDWAGIMPTEIQQVGNDKYLFYIGWSNRLDVPYHNNLGLAISQDQGNNYKKFSLGPIFATSYMEPGYVGTISIIQKDSTFFGYYLSCRTWEELNGKIEPIYDIKIAQSDNLIDWKPLNISAVALENQEGGISKASILKMNDTYYLWYAVRNKTNYRENISDSYRIKCSISENLIDWKRIDNLGLDIDLSSNWDNQMVEYPHVFEFENKIYMFYNGNNFGETGFGYAILSDENGF
ncbi:hypothetical protein V7S79_09425 [Aquirufa sp. ROCK-SH2]